MLLLMGLVVETAFEVDVGVAGGVGVGKMAEAAHCVVECAFDVDASGVVVVDGVCVGVGTEVGGAIGESGAVGVVAAAAAAFLP